MNPLRRPLIAGNWKMNAGGQQSCLLAGDIARGASGVRRVQVVVAPPFTALAAVAQEFAEAQSTIGIAAQNMHPSESGAFTGEISASMLHDSGATWVILGHSERRHLFGESDELIAHKVRSALAADLRPIVCVGETQAERESERTLEVIDRQLADVIGPLSQQPGTGVIAYEPVWAIGTGQVARPEDAALVHSHIRGLLAAVSEELAATTRILYGGSVKPDNIAAMLAVADVDGALIGGAALDASGFCAMIRTAQELAERAEEG